MHIDRERDTRRAARRERERERERKREGGREGEGEREGERKREGWVDWGALRCPIPRYDPSWLDTSDHSQKARVRALGIHCQEGLSGGGG